MQSRRSFLLGLALVSVSLPAAATLSSKTLPSTPLKSLQVGTLLSFPGNPPPGWLLCDGHAISRTYYAELFELLGTSHGAGDGVTTFNLPNYWTSTNDGSDQPINGIGWGQHPHRITALPLKIEEVPVRSHGLGQMQHDALNITMIRLSIYTGVE